jgi:hypothetical protein
MSLPLPSQWAKTVGLGEVQRWVTDSQTMCQNVQHNMGALSDLLLMSRLPELKPADMQARVQKLDVVLKKMDALLKKVDKLVKIFPPETSLRHIVDRLTRSQTTLTLLLGLFAGSFMTRNWPKSKRQKRALRFPSPAPVLPPVNTRRAPVLPRYES